MPRKQRQIHQDNLRGKERIFSLVFHTSEREESVDDAGVTEEWAKFLPLPRGGREATENANFVGASDDRCVIRANENYILPRAPSARVTDGLRMITLCERGVMPSPYLRPFDLNGQAAALDFLNFRFLLHQTARGPTGRTTAPMRSAENPYRRRFDAPESARWQISALALKDEARKPESNPFRLPIAYPRSWPR